VKIKKVFIYFIVVALTVAFLPSQTGAASLIALSDTMTRLKNSSGSTVYADHTFKFTTPTTLTDTTDKIVVTFPAAFTIGSVDYTDMDLSHGASTGYETEETLAATAGVSAWGASFTGQVLTLDHPTNAANGDIAQDDKVVIEIGQNATGGGANLQIANPNTSNTFVITLETYDGASLTDSGKVAVVTVDDDQVVLSAAVDPSITFSLSANSSAFGTLSTGSVTNAGTDITLTAGTNSANGYTVTVKDTGSGSNPGLYSSTASYLIGSTNASYDDGPTALSAGTEGYGICVSATTGSPTVATRYNTCSTTNVGGLEIAATTIISRATQMSSNDTATVKHKAAIASFTKAGSYTDTLTYIATGNF